LVLDEPAANLDAETEQLIQQALSQALKKKQPGQAVLTISHRLAGLENYDEILLFHQGRVGERGTFKELVAQQGLFWQLYQLEQSELPPLIAQFFHRCFVHHRH
jgi:ABC-type multidrug transport system fused ATPase/permease subunit